MATKTAGGFAEDEVVIHGRPDLPGGRFGITRAMRVPPYVYGYSKMACLVHKLAEIELHWYKVARGGQSLIRLHSPKRIAHTVCGQTFFLFDNRAKTCVIPRPDAVLCGRCHGEIATFSPKRKEQITKMQARMTLGCVTESGTA